MDTVDQLKKQGYRLTKPRKELLKVLATYPLTVKEIYESLKNKNIHIDLASVYRSLDLFVKMGVVHIIELGSDKKRYEIVDEQKHHHHLVCNKCGSIEDVAFDEKNLLEELQTKSTFQINHHHLEFFGLCHNCQ
ncbi:MAG: Fur family transcriptional regulator [Patescibacteria group bacterium]